VAAAPSPASAPAPGPAPAAGFAPAAGEVYVYGIVGADHRLRPEHRGVGAPPTPVRALRRGELAAVVGGVPDGLRARRRDLLAHQELLLALAADGPVLPMRFGMVAPDEAAVLDQLATGHDRYLRALEPLRGRVELNVKALPVEMQDALAALVAGDRRIRRLRDELRRSPGYEASIRLGEAVAAGLAERAAESADRLLRGLAKLSDRWVRGPEVTGCVANLSFLVEEKAQAAFQAEVERFAAAHRDRVALRLTGPLPCYSFVADDTPAHGPRVPAGA